MVRLILFQEKQEPWTFQKETDVGFIYNERRVALNFVLDLYELHIHMMPHAGGSFALFNYCVHDTQGLSK